MNKTDNAPTMIIPSGTEIQIDAQGQLSVRTPGNLVIQNSGHYGQIESVGGSIRIEAPAEVEAVSVRCADTCYVQGSLTSWKVKARSIQLEESARARIVLQESESIEIGKGAQLIGNFSSEKELFMLFSRFSQQLRSLPFYFGPAQPHEIEGGRGEVASLENGNGTHPEGASVEMPPLPFRILEAGKELPDQLFFSLVLLEREIKSEVHSHTSQRVLEELVKLLRERDLEALRHTYRTLFGRIAEPGPDISRARDLVDKFFHGGALDA